MTINALVYSHDPKAFTKKDINRIRDVVFRVKGIDVCNITVQRTYYLPVVTKEGRIDWGLFTKHLTPEAQGYNVVVFHFPKKLKRKWKVNPKINGTYRNDLDAVFEFWMCADKNKKPKGYKTKDTEVSRIFLHELLHGFKRVYGGNSNDVHVYDYTMKDVAIGYYTVKL